MKNIVKTVSLLTIISLIPAAFAATSRVSVNNKVSARLPSIAGRIINGTTTTTSSSTSYYDLGDCTTKYRDCMAADDVCGENFEECTTNVLFHVQMPKCSSVLYQCSTSGVSELFGTTSIRALSEISSYVQDERGNNTEEVKEYTYPLQDSLVHGWITGARAGNMLNKEQCIKRYTNCLKRDDVCGENFELCTSDKEFKKQAVLCDSTFARCPTEAKQELFGSVANADILKPQNVGTGDNTVYARLKTMIEDGRVYAVNNAIKTCNKVVRNCFVNACAKNPFRCVEGIPLSVISGANILGAGSDSELNSTIISADSDEVQTSSQVRQWFKSQCLETIGTNKSCHMMYRELENVPEKQLLDTELQTEVFDYAYSDPDSRGAIAAQLADAVKAFDTNAKNQCYETIKSCAMRSCGGGLGSLCYKQAKGSTSSTSSSSTNIIGQLNAVPMNTSNSNIIGQLNVVPMNTSNNLGTLSVLGTNFQLETRSAATQIGSTSSNNYSSLNIAGDATYSEIADGCEAIVNADANCQYAAATAGNTGYSYNYTTTNTFSTLFPKSSANSDPIGAIGKLNALLATSYNDAAIEKMKKQCRTIALTCAQTVCGQDYVNCYRRRTDIADAGTYNTPNKKFDSSMNQVGGVLDYNIVIGMCLNTIKNSSACEEHLKLASYENRYEQDEASWGNASSVGESWLSANPASSKYISKTSQRLVGCKASEGTKSGLALIPGRKNDCAGTQPAINGSCEGVATFGCVYDEPVYQEESEYVLNESAKTLFQELLADVEMQVQQTYNLKLTKEYNTCVNNNNGGIMGTTGAGSTFTWAKLRQSSVPGNYPSQGLTTDKFTSSNDLYGSFCLAKITIQSDDKDIQNLLKDKQTAYFAVGDSFTCGSWISDSDMRKISDTVGKRAVCKEGLGVWNSTTGECDDQKASSKVKSTYAWATIAPMLAGGAIGTALTESGVFSGLSRNTFGTDNGAGTGVNRKQAKTLCSQYAAAGDATSAKPYCEQLLGSGNTLCNNKTASVVQNACDNADVNDVDATSDGVRWAIPITTAVAGGALGAGITASVIKAKKENIKNEAAQQWMDEIGDHIKCYVGSQELGVYGDPISFSID